MSGRTAADVVSLLIYRVFGPFTAAVQPMLDLHGLAGRPATTRRAIAARHELPLHDLLRRQQRLQAEARRTHLAEFIVFDTTRRSRPGEDHLARRNLARSLNLPTPEPWSPSLAQSRAVRTCLDVLAAAGAQPISVLAGSVRRVRGGRGTLPPDNAELEALLGTRPEVACWPDRTWRLTSAWPVPERHQRLLAAATDSIYPRQGVIALLRELGYAATSAQGRTLDRHPLIARQQSDHYRVIGAAGVGASPNPWPTISRSPTAG